jgi:hypothetical protein
MSNEPSIFQQCMLLVLEQRCAGGDRKIKKDKLEVKQNGDDGRAQDKAWHASKKIFGASGEYAAITSLDTQIRTRLEVLELPAQFQRGTFAIPLKLVQQAQALVESYELDRLALIDKFCDAYEDVIDAQRAVLGPLFDITDYPVLSELRARFGVSYRWLALGVPEQLAEISVDLYNQQVQVQQEALAATMAEVQQGLRAALKGLIDHLLNRLSEKDEAGRVKRLHGSAVDKIVEFLDLLPAKNVTGDQELQRLAERARSIVTAVDVETLKKPGFERAIVEKRLGEITKSIDGLLETGKVRKFGGFNLPSAEPESKAS